MPLEFELSPKKNNPELCQPTQLLIFEEQMSAVELLAKKMTEAGFGEYHVIKTPLQLDDCKKPIEIEGVVRIEEVGEADWPLFWNMSMNVEYFLEQSRLDPSNNPKESLIEAVDESIRLENLRRNTYRSNQKRNSG